MRYRWENSILIPDLGTGSVSPRTVCSKPSVGSIPQPNLGSCLLHQKLQMLNCCIERRIKRESAGYGHEDTALHEAPSSVFEPATSLCQRDVPDNSSQTGARAERAESFASSSDEEFFECDDGEDNIAVDTDDDKIVSEANIKKQKFSHKKSLTSEKSIESSVSETSFKDSFTFRAEGRLAQIKNLHSLATGEPLYIPVTQEPSPMTEDMLEEHAEVLAKLGTTAEGSKLRARMQSACLLSDMESFKAANPGCILEDFVRWYSPRDYIDDEEEEGIDVTDRNVIEEDDQEKKEHGFDGDSLNRCKDGQSKASFDKASVAPPLEAASPAKEPKRKGQLSQRMQIPGNMWVEVWQSARPVPARRQKRLFDDTKEAEKVLHYLAGLRPGEVVLHLLPVVVHASILKLVEKEDPEVPVLKTLTDQVISKATKVTRMPYPPELKQYEEVIRLIELAETVFSRAQSLKTKLTRDLLERGKAEEELHHFVASLLQQPEVTVRGGPFGPAGSVVHRLFVASQKAAHMVVEERLEESDLGDHSLSLDVSRPPSTIPDFPPPAAREYILRAMIPHPTPYSRVLPQRMYCVLVEGDYRLAGAFCSDTTFL